MTVFVIRYWNPCFWLVICRFVTDFCHFVIEKRLCETGPRPLTINKHLGWPMRSSLLLYSPTHRPLCRFVTKKKSLLTKLSAFMALKTSPMMSCGLLCDLIPRCHFDLLTGVADTRRWLSELWLLKFSRVFIVIATSKKKKKGKWRLDRFYTVTVEESMPQHGSTVKPVYKDHSKEIWKMVFICRWSLSTGFNEKPYSRETKSVVYLYRWSLKQVWL